VKNAVIGVLIINLLVLGLSLSSCEKEIRTLRGGAYEGIR